MYLFILFNYLPISAEAILEEKEARLMQQRMAAEISEADCGLDLFTDMAESAPSTSIVTDLTVLKDPKETSDNLAVIQADFSKMSEKEKMRTFKQLYPEYMPIYNEYKRMLLEIKHKLIPLVSLNIRKILPPSDGMDVIIKKFEFMNLFVQCSLFYFMLVAGKEETKGHPVFDRLLMLQQRIKDCDEAEREFKDQMDFALQMVSARLAFFVQ